MNMDHNINKSILFFDTVICNIIPILSENKYDKDCIVGICSHKSSQKRSLDIFRLSAVTFYIGVFMLSIYT